MSRKHPKTRKLCVVVKIPALSYVGKLIVPVAKPYCPRKVVLKNTDILSVIQHGSLKVMSSGGPTGDKVIGVTKPVNYGK